MTEQYYPYQNGFKKYDATPLQNFSTSSSAAPIQNNFGTTSISYTSEPQNFWQQYPPQEFRHPTPPSRPVESLLYFFRTLLEKTDFIDQRRNHPIEMSISQRIKILLQRLLRGELQLPQFASLVEITVHSHPNHHFLPFLQSTFPYFMEAVYNGSINIDWLLPLQPIPFPGALANFHPYISAVAPPNAFPMHANEMGIEATANAGGNFFTGIHMLQPMRHFDPYTMNQCVNIKPERPRGSRPTLTECVVIGTTKRRSGYKTERIDYENMRREALTDLFLNPREVIRCIRECMGSGCYIEEEAIRVISEGIQCHLNEIIEELVDVATLRVKRQIAAEEGKHPSEVDTQAVLTVPDLDAYVVRQSTLPETDTSNATSSDNSIFNFLNFDIFDDLMKEVIDDNGAITGEEGVGKSAPKFTHLGQVYSPDELLPGESYQRLIRVNMNDLEIVASQKKSFRGKVTEFKLATKSYSPYSST